MNEAHLINELCKLHRMNMEDYKKKLFEKLKGTTSLTEDQERKIFEYAWDEGHSAGECEVKGHFDRLVKLVEDCLK